MTRDEDTNLEPIRRVNPVPDLDALPTYARGTDPVWHTIVARAASDVGGDVDHDVEHGRVEPTRRRGNWRIGLAAVGVATVVALQVVTVQQRETRVDFTDPAAVDVCRLLELAEDMADIPDGEKTSLQNAHIEDHGGEVTDWGARTCVVDTTDDGYVHLHLLWREEPTTRKDAERLLAQPRHVLLRDSFPPNLPGQSWAVSGPNRWTVQWSDADLNNDPGVAWAVAVLEEPYFFIVTDADDFKAHAVADAIAELLDDPPTKP